MKKLKRKYEDQSKELAGKKGIEGGSELIAGKNNNASEKSLLSNSV